MALNSVTTGLLSVLILLITAMVYSVKITAYGLLIGCVLNADYAGQAKQISQEAAKAGVMVLIAVATWCVLRLRSMSAKKR